DPREYHRIRLDAASEPTEVNGMPGEILFRGVDSVSLQTGDAADLVTVVRTNLPTEGAAADAYQLTLGPRAGADRLATPAVAANASVNGGCEADTVDVGSQAGLWETDPEQETSQFINVLGTLDDIQALLTLNGQGGADQLNADDTGDASDNVGTLSST